MGFVSQAATYFLLKRREDFHCVLAFIYHFCKVFLTSSIALEYSWISVILVKTHHFRNRDCQHTIRGHGRIDALKVEVSWDEEASLEALGRLCSPFLPLDAAFHHQLSIAHSLNIDLSVNKILNVENELKNRWYFCHRIFRRCLKC